MQRDAPNDPDASAELPAIEFDSPGRFSVHNPDTNAPATESRVVISPTTQDRVLQRFSSPEEARAHALALLHQANRSLNLYSPDLEPWLYSNSGIQQACSRFLLAHPRNRLWVLVRDTGRVVREGHQLLTLARRLTSKLHIRKLNPEYPSEDCAFIIVDNRSLLVRPKVDQYAGYALYNDPGKARLRQSQFDQAWDHSLSDPDLRSFLL
ncbi:DUF7931 domain-containing protein [Stutzerimonas nitrititolerans]|uniref:DUF7931 domain-containing protein n=1 Tax=Stutzerimonas nitrititolerans TaxID=2482751 RepID=UPI0028B15AFE|nr:histone acetyltransferase HPA2 [Stutzerimonas nitrititolerans]